MDVDVEIKDEIEDTADYDYNAMTLLELSSSSQCDELIEFNSTDAIMNPKTGLLVCLLCTMQCKPDQLHNHMTYVHNYRKLFHRCPNCLSIFPDQEPLIVHLKSCKKSDTKKKKRTFKQIYTETEAEIANLNDTDMFPCPICYLDLEKVNVIDHMLKEHSTETFNKVTYKHNEEPATCDICHRIFKSTIIMKEHIKLVHNAVKGSVECEKCGQKFSSMKYLRNHRRNVHPKDDRIHQCHICEKIFKSHLSLYQHIKYVHPPPSSAVQCPHCPDKKYKTNINLTQHLRVSHGIYKSAEKDPLVEDE